MYNNSLNLAQRIIFVAVQLPQTIQLISRQLFNSRTWAKLHFDQRKTEVVQRTSVTTTANGHPIHRHLSHHLILSYFLWTLLCRLKIPSSTTRLQLITITTRWHHLQEPSPPAIAVTVIEEVLVALMSATRKTLTSPILQLLRTILVVVAR